jgi:hypothetical protein
MIDLETALDIVTFVLAVVALLLMLWVWKISKQDMLHSFTLISIVAIGIFACGKFLDALNLGFFGTKVFSNLLELILMLGIVTAISSFYEKWRREDSSPA